MDNAVAPYLSIGLVYSFNEMRELQGQLSLVVESLNCSVMPRRRARRRQVKRTDSRRHDRPN
jgi:hypothetical protein